MKPKLKIATGTDSFRELITTSDVFVDKSLFIKEIVDSRDKAILITRPRRWGKSIALDMLKTFLAIEVDAEGTKVATNSNSVLFEGGDVDLGFGEKKSLLGTKIAKEDPKYLARQGAYPVIFFSLKDARYKSYIAAESGLRSIINRFFQDFRYLTNSAQLYDDQKTKFSKFINTPQDLTIEELKDSLRFLTELLCNHHCQKVYVLVDEFDKPVNYFLEQGIDKNIDERRQVAGFVTSIIGACGKTNNFLEKIILTGIFDAFTKEGNSGFNNLKVFDIGHWKFAEHFGFTEEEIKASFLTPMHLDYKVMPLIKEWYNGYRVPTISGFLEVYSAWAVANYISALNDKSDELPRGYWEESGVNWVLNTLQIPKETLDILKSISEGTPSFLSTTTESLMTILDKSVAETDPSLITYLLFNSGYLTLTQESKFRLPNKEVHDHFKNTVLKRWIAQELTILGVDSSIISRALSDNLHNKEKFLEILQKGIIDKVAGGDKSEAYFQTLIGGIIELYHLSNPHAYQVIVEKPVKGAGRIDNIFYPAAGATDKPVIIHEYKKLDKTHSSVVGLTLEQSIWQTLEQGYLGEPISKKKAHGSSHTWNKVELRGIVFIKDETNGTWSVQLSEVLSFSFEEAEKICGFFEDSFVRKILEVTDNKIDAPRQTLLQEASISPSSPNKIQKLCTKILDETHPLLEELKKKTIDIIKGLLPEITDDAQKTEVAKIILKGAGEVPQDVDSEITKKFPGINLGAKHKAIELVADKKARKDQKTKRDPDAAAASGSQIIHHSLMSTEEVDKFYFKYYGSGIDSLLQIRLRSLNHGKNVVILGSSYLLKDNVYLLLERVLGKMEKKDGIAVLPLNIEGKHWVGLLIAKQGIGLTITYLDSENLTLAIDIKKEISRWTSDGDYDVQFRAVKFEQQRYGNCGPELVENFVMLLTGTRATQEASVPLHSLLYANSLLDPDSSALQIAENSRMIEQLSNQNSPLCRMSTLEPKVSAVITYYGSKPQEYNVAAASFSLSQFLQRTLEFGNHKLDLCFKYVSTFFKQNSYIELQSLADKYDINIQIVDAHSARSAYKKIAVKTHPDKVSGNAEDFMLVKELSEQQHLEVSVNYNQVMSTLEKGHAIVKAGRIVTDIIKMVNESEQANIAKTLTNLGYLVENLASKSIGMKYVSGVTIGCQVYQGDFKGALTSTVTIAVYALPGLLITTAPALAVTLKIGFIAYDAYYTTTELYEVFPAIDLVGKTNPFGNVDI